MIVSLTMTVGLVAFPGVTDYLIARHAGASVEFVPVRVRPGRRELS